MLLRKNFILLPVLIWAGTSVFSQAIYPLADRDKLFFNAKIFTANPVQPFAEAILVHDDKIVAVGNSNNLRRMASKKVTQIDLKGGCLLPGLIDSHSHAVEGGDGLGKPNVFDRPLTIQQISDYAHQVKVNLQAMIGGVIVIEGINIATWSSLNQISDAFNNGEFRDQPVLLRGSDGHTSWANEAALHLAHINKDFIHSLSIADKKFYGFNGDEMPNGFMSESGQKTIDQILPTNQIDYPRSAARAMEYYNKFGVTAWLDPSTGNTARKTAPILLAYAHLDSLKELTAHIAATLVAEPDSAAEPQIAWVKSLQNLYNRKDLKVLGFKVFADGVVENPTHTAALSISYTGTNSKGVLMYDANRFKDFAVKADKQGLLIHVHAIGDLAVTKTLDGFEAARKANGNKLIPHTITHMQFVGPNDIPRFAQLNVLASLQLLWALGDITTIDIVKPYIDPSIYRYQYPSRTLLQAGAVICGASDWPVSSGNPFEAMYIAETRKGDLGVLDSSQCMPRFSMLYAYTINAAKALMMEKHIGSLVPGKSADMILVDRDVFTTEPEKFRDTRVIWTLFEGRPVFDQDRKVDLSPFTNVAH